MQVFVHQQYFRLGTKHRKDTFFFLKTISTNRVSVTKIFKQVSSPEHPLFKHTTTSHREYYPLLLDSYLQYVDLYN